jgi:hypothetical protein
VLARDGTPIAVLRAVPENNDESLGKKPADSSILPANDLQAAWQDANRLTIIGTGLFAPVQEAENEDAALARACCRVLDAWRTDRRF